MSEIAVIVRTYNEEQNLKRFIDAYYSWVDYILVLDDFSIDRTYLLTAMMEYSKVYVAWGYGERIERENWDRAKHHEQLNHLIEWAEGWEVDWIIMDDCDSVPTKALQERGRKILERTNRDFVYSTRLNFYKDQGYFPDLSKPDGSWAYCLWAWRANKEFKFIDQGDKPQRFERPEQENILKLRIPFSLLHYPWSDDSVIMEKRKRYTAIYGDEYSEFDPLKFGGELEEAPEWAVY